MSDHIHTQQHDPASEPDYRASVRRWRLAALAAFAAGAAAMAAAPVAAEPRPEHSGASSYESTAPADCDGGGAAEPVTPALSDTGGTMPGYVYSGGSWGSADGSVPEGAAD